MDRDVKLDHLLGQGNFLEREDQNNNRLHQLLTEPDQILPAIRAAMNQLDGYALRNLSESKEPTSQVIRTKWEIMEHTLSEFRDELDRSGVTVFIGGSILYQDAKEANEWSQDDRPDFDLVIYGVRPKEAIRPLVQRIEEKFYENDPELAMVDLLYVEWESFEQFVHNFRNPTADPHPGNYSRSDFRYFNHILTGFPVFLGKGKNKSDIADLRERILEVYGQIPELGALCALDLEKVVALREEKRRPHRQA